MVTDWLLVVALVVTALACAYIAAYTALEWVLGRYSHTDHRQPMCACNTMLIDDGLISVTMSGTTHTRTVCHPESS